MDVDAAGAAGGSGARLLGIAIALNTGGEAEQVVPVPQRERQARDLRLTDDGAERGLLGVDQRRHRFDGDVLLEPADGECEVESRALAGIEGQAFAGLLESLQLDFDGIVAGNECRDRIGALCVGDGRRRHVGGNVARRDGGARHDRLGLIFHRSGQRRALDLRRRRDRRAQDERGAHGT